ncbi:MAG: tetratricopeptide repeat protein, partial [marine benthic group bacterium]|nr:tetratricopeptide repeat protein [Gemmatimonadota bacterium]
SEVPIHQRFFAELKRRRVFRVMAVYGAVGFVILQVVELLVPALLLPEWTYRLVALLLIVGFPIAIVLAWAFESTPDGVRRTDPAESGELEAIASAPAAKRWPSGLLALAGAAALIGSVWVVTRDGPEESAGGEPASAGPSPTAAAGSAAGDESVLQLAYADLSEDDRPSVAVLPFVNMSSDTEQEYFADGMTEELLNALAKIRELRVAGRTSSFAYKGEDKDLREIGSELGVRYLVEGSVRKQGDDLRITAQLVDAEDAFHLWSETYDRTLDNVFAIQTEIAESVAEALEVSLGLNDEESLVTPTADMEAYDLYLAAQSRLRVRGQGVADAIRLFGAVVERDPSFAPAWAGLALAHSVAPYYEQVPLDPEGWRAGWEPSLIEAEEAASRALELDPELVIAEVALGNVYKERLDWAEAEDHYLRALAIDPDNGEAHQQYAESLTNTARFAEALRSARRAAALDPTAAVRLNALAYVSGHNGRREEQIELLKQALLLNPDFEQPLSGLLWTLEFEGRLDEAEAIARRRLESGDEALPILLGTGPDVDLKAMIDEYYAALRARDSEALEACCGEHLVYPSWLSVGDLDRALESVVEIKDLTRGFGSSWIHGIWDPRFDPVRDDPRFAEVLRDLGLEGVVPDRALPGDSR